MDEQEATLPPTETPTRRGAGADGVRRIQTEDYARRQRHRSIIGSKRMNENEIRQSEIRTFLLVKLTTETTDKIR